MNEPSRRSFLRQTALLWATLPSVSLLGKCVEVFASEQRPVPVPTGEAPVSESDSVATVLGFHQDAKQTDFLRFPERGKPSSKSQFCQSCVQFTRLNDGWGRCNVITSGVVSAQGWCGSWSKKS